jgi:hypothetical protein
MQIVPVSVDAGETFELSRDFFGLKNFPESVRHGSIHRGAYPVIFLSGGFLTPMVSTQVATSAILQIGAFPIRFSFAQLISSQVASTGLFL